MKKTINEFCEQITELPKELPTETAQQRARRKYRERKAQQGLVEVRVYVPEGMEGKIEKEARKLRDFAGIHLTKDLIV